jgi:hypothetical protein
MAGTQYGKPLIVRNFTDTAARGVTRIRFQKGDDQGSNYNEKWLQKLISRYPSVLPIEQIEPALTPAIPICMELPLASGFVDNLYATPDGDLIVGEAKLFRNPEARRAVVGQVIDYAKDLSALSYEKLEDAIKRAEAPDGDGGHPKDRLYEAVTKIVGHEEINEEQFIDAVSRNLKRGRFLLLVIGDGIQEGIENIATFLHQHAGMHFTLGLVDLAIFALPSEMGGYLVQPRILAHTMTIERGIVTIEDERIKVRPPPDQRIDSKDVAKRTTISAEKFYEKLAANYPAVVPKLKAFTNRLEATGIAIEFGKDSMILRWRPDENHAWNLGTIMTSGKVWTDVLNGQADAVGLLNLSHAYLKRLASLVPGAYVKESTKPTSWYVAKGVTYITIDTLLDHEDGWLAAIREFMAAASDAIKDQ